MWHERKLPDRFTISWCFPTTPIRRTIWARPKSRPRSVSSAYKKVFNDLTGQLIPIERIFQGEEGQVLSPLNRFNQDVYTLISSAPRFGAPNTFPRGSHGPLDIGAKVRENSCYFGLILQLPFAGTVNSPSSEAMPKYYYFPMCVCENDDFEEMGTAAEEILLAITAQQVFIPGNNSSTNVLQGGTWLYSNSISITLPTPD